MVSGGYYRVWRSSHEYLVGALLDVPLYDSIIQIMVKAGQKLQSTTTSQCSFAVANIQSIIELWVDNMDLAWIDPDNRSVQYVQLRDLPSIPSRLDYIIVTLIPEGQCYELRPRERGERT